MCFPPQSQPFPDLIIAIVTFHNISNPYEDPTEPSSNRADRDKSYSPYQYQPPPSSQDYDATAVAQLQAAVSSIPNPHSLHALSQAIELHTPPQANMLPPRPSTAENPYDTTFEDSPSAVETSTPFVTTPAMATARKALNTPTVVDPSIDPDLMKPSPRPEHTSPTKNSEQPSQSSQPTDAI